MTTTAPADHTSRTITAEETAAIKNAFESVAFDSFFDATNLNVNRELIVYQGFEINFVLAMLLRLSKDRSILGSFEKDIGFMIILFLERGSNVDNFVNFNRSGMKEDGVNLVDKFKRIYKLEKSGRKNRTAITLPRVAACFPYMTCYYAQFHRVSKPIVTGKMGCMEVSTFAAVYPTETPAKFSENTYNFIWGEHVIAMMMLSRVIDKTFSKKTEEDQKSIVRSYADIANSTSLLSNEQRLIRIKSLGVVDRLDTYEDGSVRINGPKSFEYDAEVEGVMSKLEAKRVSSKLVVSKILQAAANLARIDLGENTRPEGM